MSTGGINAAADRAGSAALASGNGKACNTYAHNTPGATNGQGPATGYAPTNGRAQDTDDLFDEVTAAMDAANNSGQNGGPDDTQPIFPPFSLEDLFSEPPEQWLIDQIISPGDIAMIFGQPGSGKTFVATDLIFAACTGNPFAGTFATARPLNVAYCASEGVSGLAKRFRAAAEKFGIDDPKLPSLTIFKNVPQLFIPDRGGAIAETIEAFAMEWRKRQDEGKVGSLDLCIVDTYHGATYGSDENSAQDVGSILKKVKALAASLGCAVILVHHSNKAGTGERGSSALRGAMDCMIEINGVESCRRMICSKLKNGERWQERTFVLEPRGDSVTVEWNVEISAASGNNKEAADKARLLSVLKQNAGKRMTARALAETIGKSDVYARKLLSEMVDSGTCKRELEDVGKAQTKTNPWVYFVYRAGEKAHE